MTFKKSKLKILKKSENLRETSFKNIFKIIFRSLGSILLLSGQSDGFNLFGRPVSGNFNGTPSRGKFADMLRQYTADVTGIGRSKGTDFNSHAVGWDS